MKDRTFSYHGSPYNITWIRDGNPRTVIKIEGEEAPLLILQGEHGAVAAACALTGYYQGLADSKESNQS